VGHSCVSFIGMIKLPDGRSVSQPPAMKGRTNASDNNLNNNTNAALVTWKAGSVLPDDVNDALFRVEELLRAAPTTATTTTTTATTTTKTSSSMDPSQVRTCEQYYAWVASLEQEALENNSNNSNNNSNNINNNNNSLSSLHVRRTHTQQLIDHIQQALDGLNYLSTSFVSIQSRLSPLHDATEALLAERKSLVTLANGWLWSHCIVVIFVNHLVFIDCFYICNPLFFHTHTPHQQYTNNCSISALSISSPPNSPTVSQSPTRNSYRVSHNSIPVCVSFDSIPIIWTVQNMRCACRHS
jgi:hypothetical protein